MSDEHMDLLTRRVETNLETVVARLDKDAEEIRTRMAVCALLPPSTLWPIDPAP